MRCVYFRDVETRRGHLVIKLCSEQEALNKSEPTELTGSNTAKFIVIYRLPWVGLRNDNITIKLPSISSLVTMSRTNAILALQEELQKQKKRKPLRG